MIYLLIGILLLLYVALAYFISGTVVHLNRQPVPKNPKDYGMDFEPVEFTTEDGIRIKGWLIPGAKPKLVIMTHVGGLTRYGSTRPYRNLTKLYNQEIEFLKTARHLHHEGCWVLMFDFRNHGESGPDPNHGMAGVGLEEYKDVVAAMQLVRNREEMKNFEVGFVSFCMGANATIIAMSKRPEAFKGVKCLMAIQPISMEVFVRTYAKIIFTPPLALLLMPLIKIFIILRGAHPLEKMSPKEYAKDLKVPTLYVQAIHDPWTELTDILSFYEATTPPKEFFWIENTKHRFESYSYFQDKPEKMLAWLRKWLPA